MIILSMWVYPEMNNNAKNNKINEYNHCFYKHEIWVTYSKFLFVFLFSTLIYVIYTIIIHFRINMESICLITVLWMKKHTFYLNILKAKDNILCVKTCSLLLLLTKPPNSFEAMPTENGTGLGWIKAYTLIKYLISGC